MVKSSRSDDLTSGIDAFVRLILHFLRKSHICIPMYHFLVNWYVYISSDIMANLILGQNTILMQIRYPMKMSVKYKEFLLWYGLDM